MPKPLIIDCDPGVDDAIALLLTLASPEDLTLLGVTTVAGNVPLDLTYTNARKICHLASKPDTPVFPGCPRPLIRPLTTAQDVHGKTGLHGLDIDLETTPDSNPKPQHAVQFLISTLLDAPAPITLVAIGPLTNIAVAIIQAPKIIENIAEIVIMGGAITHGNVTPTAEFNTYVDPHAAHIVFTSGANITLFTLDLTHQLITTPTRLAALRALSTPVATTAATMLDHYGTFDRARYGNSGGFLHDPSTIAYLLDPTLFSGRSFSVQVDITSELTMGQTVIDLWQVSEHPPNAFVMEQADADGFYRLLGDRLHRHK